MEADPAEVNLSAFETFFNERRPFFVEGSGAYQFECDDCSIFYSRRIGRPPRGAPETGGGFVVIPGQSTILGAGKLTGRLGRFSVGTLTAVTQEEEARLAFGDIRWREPVEPQTFYTVSRVRREFADQSSVGLILTSANRGRIDALSFLPDSAVTSGADYDWRLGQRWSLTGTWAGSHVAGSVVAIAALQRSNVHSYQRPDADHVEFDPTADSMTGHAGSLGFGKIAGDKVRGNVMLAYKTPGFEVNEVGFLRRADEIKQRAWIQRRWMDPGKYVRTKIVNFNQWSNHNFGGDRIELGGNFNTHWTFMNRWSTRRRRQRQRPHLRRPLHPRRPGGLPQPERQRLVLLQHRRQPRRQLPLGHELLRRSADRVEQRRPQPQLLPGPAGPVPSPVGALGGDRASARAAATTTPSG